VIQTTRTVTNSQEEADATPSFRVDGQVALVTGAGRGIGRGCALALAAAGADVVVMSRTRSELEEVVSEAHVLGRKAHPVVCDVTDSGGVADAIASLERIDILVNNAGTNFPEPFIEVTEQHLDALLALNVKAIFLVSQAVVRLMAATNAGGSIINVSSQMGHVGAAGRTAYCTTKHAVEGLTKALAVELAPQGIRVNSVAPTFIETPLTASYLADERFRERMLDQIPLGRVGQVGDVVGAVVFLASPAAALITGASLLVDGGWTAK
jgi:NAD(P)-dependent dehydrogenase (short-subunit alcohol dehydrogenase family)